MNIFYVHQDPIIAAQSLVDRHVVKMILESAQLLSTAHRVIDGSKQIITNNGRKKTIYKLYDSREPIVYQATHVNHPSAIWCRQSVENYNWLVDHMYGLIDEYKFRYNKNHKCNDVAFYLQSPPHNLKQYEWTEMLCAMDDTYKISHDPIENYRNYYIKGKPHLHKWTNRQPPSWIV